MDPLFHTQRYWGSDDSDVEEENSRNRSKSNKLQNLVKIEKENQNRKSTDAKLVPSNSSEIVYDESFSKKKKRKQHSEKCEDEGIYNTSTKVHSEEPSDADNTAPRKRKKTKNYNFEETSQTMDMTDSVASANASKNSEEVGNKIPSVNSEIVGSKNKKKHVVSDKQETFQTSTMSFGEENGSVTDSTLVDSEGNISVAKKGKSSSKSKPIEIGSQDSSNAKTKKKSRKRKNKAISKATNGSISSCPPDDEKEEQKEQDSGDFPVIKDVRNKIEFVPRVLPDWLSKPTFIKGDIEGKEMPVSELDFLDSNTKENLAKSKISYLFPVQFHVIPWLLQSSLKRFIVRPSDVCVSAPTGSGKTLAFVIPIVQSLKHRVVQEIRAVVVLPVGDLAVQVFKVFQSFCKGTDLTVSLVIGQKSFSQEQCQLVRPCSRGFMALSDIIVCTPGRLMDHISRTAGFSLKQLQYLVIDEADRMMEEIQQGWLKKVEEAIYNSRDPQDCKCFGLEGSFQKLKTSPSSSCSFGCIAEPMQKLLYSATLSQDPDKLHELSLYRPKLFTTTSKISPITSNKKDSTQNNNEEFIGKYMTPESLVEQYVVCDTSIKPLVICCLLKKYEFKKVLCFTRSLEHAHRLSLVLMNMLELNIREISSNMRAVQRKIILDQFSSGKVNVIVCSDIMSRGMDIEDIDCVISYDAPEVITKYIHRIGRTARAGKEGVTITLLEDSEVKKFERMLTLGGKSTPAKLEIDDLDLKCFEENFKTALDAAAKEIAEENSKISLMKKTARNNVKNVKIFCKNQNFRKVKRKNNQNRQ